MNAQRKPRANQWTPADDDRMLSLVGAMALVEIGKLLGRSGQAVSNRLLEIRNQDRPQIDPQNPWPRCPREMAANAALNNFRCATPGAAMAWRIAA